VAVTTEGSDRQHHVGQLLRQLSIGLSAYRLYPGDLEQPGFVGTVRRIDAAAARVLAEGPLEAGVTADTFVVDGAPVPPDETIARLADACYQRRVERLRVRMAPNPLDLDALYSILAMPVEEVLAEGGASSMLSRSAVMSILLAEVNPRGIESAPLSPEHVGVERGTASRGCSSTWPSASSDTPPRWLAGSCPSGCARTT
jgi:hypothetical protein